MNIEEIKKILGDYQKLIDLVHHKVMILERNDFQQYNTYRGIETIDFEDDNVLVICDDTCFGVYDTNSFRFPLKYITMEDDELIKTVLLDKEARLENDKKLAEENKIKQEELEKQRELDLYKKLKNKFENM